MFIIIFFCVWVLHVKPPIDKQNAMFPSWHAYFTIELHLFAQKSQSQQMCCWTQTYQAVQSLCYIGRLIVFMTLRHLASFVYKPWDWGNIIIECSAFLICCVEEEYFTYLVNPPLTTLCVWERIIGVVVDEAFLVFILHAHIIISPF